MMKSKMRSLKFQIQLSSDFQKYNIWNDAKGITKDGEDTEASLKINKSWCGIERIITKC